MTRGDEGLIAGGGAVARRSIIFSDVDLSGPKGKTLPLLAKASWLSLVEPTLSDKPWLDVIQTETDAIADERAAGPTAFMQ